MSNLLIKLDADLFASYISSFSIDYSLAYELFKQLEIDDLLKNYYNDNTFNFNQCLLDYSVFLTTGKK